VHIDLIVLNALVMKLQHWYTGPACTHLPIRQLVVLLQSGGGLSSGHLLQWASIDHHTWGVVNYISGFASPRQLVGLWCGTQLNKKGLCKCEHLLLHCAYLLKVQCHIGKLLLDVTHNLTLSSGREGVATLCRASMTLVSIVQLTTCSLVTCATDLMNPHHIQPSLSQGTPCADLPMRIFIR
jgi:hypothetical protein